MAEDAARLARVQRLLDAARELQSPHTRNGGELRGKLLATSGLSAANIELGLVRCLETTPSREHLQALLASTPVAPAAHVLLSGNVFVAALRAVAIGVCASEHVWVRPSRRDPALASALQTLAPELFQIAAELSPRPGDHLWSYGADETLRQVRETLPASVWFHAHGSGFGAAVVTPATFGADEARALALDTVLFDQRGCLSPRVVCVLGTAQHAESVARILASELGALESELPPGPRSTDEQAELRRQRDAAAYAFELLDAGTGFVTVGDRFALPPANRSLHVLPCRDAVAVLGPLSKHLTTIGTNLSHTASPDHFGQTRWAALGDMQRPPLDGPVDRRHPPQGTLT